MTQTIPITSEPLSPGDELASLPIFPLPNVVFFPGTLLPLHIFEPRYRAMISHAMDTDQRLGVVLLKAGYEDDYHGTPEVHGTFCVGEIAMYRPLPDGRSNIVLRGLGRARILEEHDTAHPFRLVRATTLGGELLGQQGDPLERHLATVRQLFASIVARVPQLQVQDADSLFSPEADPGSVLDSIASAIPAPPERKQEMLSALNMVQRASLLADALAEALADTLTTGEGEG